MSAKRVDLQAFARELNVWSTWRLKALRDAAAKGVARSIPDLVAASPVDTGLYAQSWDMRVDEMAVILGNYAPHAPIIEYGARPFTPPLGPLLAWAKRVLGGGGKNVTGQPETGYSDEVWALARYTQAKIAREGIKPRHIMENMIPQIIENIKGEMKLVS
jgi:hypothetical protein